MADFPGVGRYQAVAFSVNGKGYVGTGYDGNSKKDFWQYDPATNAWTQKPSFGGNKRLGAVSFTINGLGYLLTGSDNAVALTDVWFYDPGTEQWTEHKPLIDDDDAGYDYSGVPRLNGISFVINNLGYVAAGTNPSTGNLTTCWAYDPTADTWKQKTAFEGVARTLAVGFGIGNLGYIGSGTTGTTRLDDFWALDPEAEND